MSAFTKAIEVRWADLDPNFHLRHSVYYDYGATARIAFLQEHGLTAGFMQEHAFGPIIFREECLFKKEIRQTDTITIDLVLLKATPDYSRWTIRHNIYKDGVTVAAILTVDGAWMDVVKRRLTVPPAVVIETFDQMPRGDQPTK